MRTLDAKHVFIKIVNLHSNKVGSDLCVHPHPMMKLPDPSQNFRTYTALRNNVSEESGQCCSLVIIVPGWCCSSSFGHILSYAAAVHFVICCSSSFVDCSSFADMLQQFIYSYAAAVHRYRLADHRWRQLARSVYRRVCARY